MSHPENRSVAHRSSLQRPSWARPQSTTLIWDSVWFPGWMVIYGLEPLRSYRLINLRSNKKGWHIRTTSFCFISSPASFVCQVVPARMISYQVYQFCEAKTFKGTKLYLALMHQKNLYEPTLLKGSRTSTHMTTISTAPLHLGILSWPTCFIYSNKINLYHDIYLYIAYIHIAMHIYIYIYTYVCVMMHIYICIPTFIAIYKM